MGEKQPTAVLTVNREEFEKLEKLKLATAV